MMMIHRHLFAFLDFCVIRLAEGDYPPHPTSSNEKAKRLFNMEFKTLPETFKEVYEQWSALGWLAHLEH